MKICKITVFDDFCPDNTGSGGFQWVKVIADILFDNKIFSINVAKNPYYQYVKDYDFDIWAKARHNINYPKITNEDYINAINGFYQHLVDTYTVDYLLQFKETLMIEINELIQEAEYGEVLYETKDSIVKEIELLQKKLNFLT